MIQLLLVNDLISLGVITYPAYLEDYRLEEQIIIRTFYMMWGCDHHVLNPFHFGPALVLEEGRKNGHGSFSWADRSSYEVCEMAGTFDDFGEWVESLGDRCWSYFFWSDYKPSNMVRIVRIGAIIPT